MKYSTLNFKQFKQFSPLFIDYLKNNKETLKPLYRYYPSKDNVLLAAKNKTFKSRKLLFDTLSNQNKSLLLSEKTRKNIELLKNENTFTITTGHQLSLLTGPLYFIYKILTVINMADELNAEQSESHFVPVFWLASEDHDFDEIKNVKIFSNNYEWLTSQSGAVGRFHTDGLQSLLDSLPEKLSLFDNALKQASSYTYFVKYIVNELFGDYGLVIVDGDDKDFKNLFTPFVIKEITEGIGKTNVQKTDSLLNEFGYATQIHARDINLFHLKNNSRKRIILQNQEIKDIDGSFICTVENLTNYVNKHSDEFSPNVVLRPLYQEVILPNVAYIGGPAEVVYWLQLHDMFNAFGVDFPVIVPRIHAFYIPSSIQKKIEKLQISFEDLLVEEKTLIAEYMSKHDNEIIMNKEEMIGFFDVLKEKSKSIDPSLITYLDAEKSRWEKNAEHVLNKIQKAKEKKHEGYFNQVKNIKDKLFPNGGLQERSENIFTYYFNNQNIISEMKNKLKPFVQEFQILIEE